MAFFRWLAWLWRTRNCEHPRTRRLYGDERMMYGYRARCIDCGKPLERDGSPLAADFKTESLEAVDSIVRGVGCICPMVDTSTYTDRDATMSGYDSRCGVHGGK